MSEIIPPGPPCFACGGLSPQAERASSKRRGRSSNARAERLDKALFGLQSQCRRALLRPPAAGRPLLRFAEAAVLMEKIARFLGVEFFGGEVQNPEAVRRAPVFCTELSNAFRSEETVVLTEGISRIFGWAFFNPFYGVRHGIFGGAVRQRRNAYCG